MAYIEIMCVGGTIEVDPDPAGSKKRKKVKWKNKCNSTVFIDFGNQTPFNESYFGIEPGEKEKLVTYQGPVPKRFKYTVLTATANLPLDPELIIEPEG